MADDDAEARKDPEPLVSPEELAEGRSPIVVNRRAGNCVSVGYGEPGEDAAVKSRVGADETKQLDSIINKTIISNDAGTKKIEAGKNGIRRNSENYAKMISENTRGDEKNVKMISENTRGDEKTPLMKSESFANEWKPLGSAGSALRKSEWASDTPKCNSDIVKCNSDMVKCVSSTPKCVSDTLKCVSDTPKCVSSTPKCVSDTLKCVSDTPKCVSNTPTCVPDTPKCVSDTSKCVSNTPKCVSDIPKFVSDTPNDVSNTYKFNSHTPKANSSNYNCTTDHSNSKYNSDTSGRNSDMPKAATDMSKCNSVTSKCDSATSKCNSDTSKCNPDTSKCNSDTSKCNSDTSKCNSVTSKCNSDTSKCNSVTSKCNSDTSKCNSVTSTCNSDTSKCNLDTSKCNSVTSECNSDTSKCNSDTFKGNSDASKYNSVASKCNSEVSIYNSNNSDTSTGNSDTFTANSDTSKGNPDMSKGISDTCNNISDTCNNISDSFKPNSSNCKSIADNSKNISEGSNGITNHFEWKQPVDDKTKFLSDDRDPVVKSECMQNNDWRPIAARDENYRKNGFASRNSARKNKPESLLNGEDFKSNASADESKSESARNKYEAVGTKNYARISERNSCDGGQNEPESNVRMKNDAKTSASARNTSDDAQNKPESTVCPKNNLKTSASGRNTSSDVQNKSESTVCPKNDPKTSGSARNTSDDVQNKPVCLKNNPKTSVSARNTSDGVQNEPESKVRTKNGPQTSASARNTSGDVQNKPESTACLKNDPKTSASARNTSGDVQNKPECTLRCKNDPQTPMNFTRSGCNTSEATQNKPESNMYAKNDHKTPINFTASASDTFKVAQNKPESTLPTNNDLGSARSTTEATHNKPDATKNSPVPHPNDNFRRNQGSVETLLNSKNNPDLCLGLIRDVGRYNERPLNKPKYGRNESEFCRNEPGFSQNEPEFAQTEQEFAHNRHAFGQNEPEFAQTEPEFAHNRPAFDQNEPEFYQEPEFAKKEPDFGQNQPVLGQNVPDLGQYKPDLGHYKPDLGQYKPDLGQNQPDLDQNQPDSGQNNTKALSSINEKTKPDLIYKNSFGYAKKKPENDTKEHFYESNLIHSSADVTPLQSPLEKIPVNDSQYKPEFVQTMKKDACSPEFVPTKKIDSLQTTYSDKTSLQTPTNVFNKTSYGPKFVQTSDTDDAEFVQTMMNDSNKTQYKETDFLLATAGGGNGLIPSLKTDSNKSPRGHDAKSESPDRSSLHVQFDKDKTVEDEGSMTSSSESGSSSESIEIAESRPPDGGWGWVVVFASFIVNLIADGITFSFGVIFVEFLNYFGENRGKTAWIGSLFMAMPLLSGPIASFLTDRYGCRRVTIVGSILASSGFVISSQANSMEVLFITFGVLAGFGLSLCYVASVVIVAYYFDKRRSFATGLSVCGSGIGTFIFAPLTQMLLHEYGWRGTTMILAGLFLNLAVCGALMRDLPWTPSHKAKRQRKKNRELKKKKNSSSAETFSVSNSTNTASVLQPILEETRFEDNTDINRLCSSLVSLPTYVRNGEKVPIEVIELLSTHKNVYNVLMQNYPNLLTPSRSFSDSGRLNEAVHQHNTKFSRAQSPPALTSPTNTTSDAAYVWWLKRNQITPPRLNPQKKITTAAYLKDLRVHRLSLTYRGAMLNINRYKLRASSCPDIYRNSMTTIAKEKSEWRSTFREFWAILVDMFDFSHFADPKFLIFAISNFLLYTWYDVPYVYLADHAIEMGFTEDDSSMLIGIIGIVNMFGEIILGWAGDRPWINAGLIYAFCMALCGAVTATVPVLTSYWALCTVSGLFGLFIAANYSLTCIILVELITLERFTNAYGLLLLVQGVANLIGPPLGGWLCDVTGNYNISFYLAGIFIALSGALLVILPMANRYRSIMSHRRQSSNERNADVNDDGEAHFHTVLASCITGHVGGSKNNPPENHV